MRQDDVVLAEYKWVADKTRGPCNTNDLIEQGIHVFFNYISYTVVNICLVAYILAEADEHALVLREEDVSNFYERLQS